MVAKGTNPPACGAANPVGPERRFISSLREFVRTASLVGKCIYVIPDAAIFILAGGGVTEFPLGPNERERLRVLHASGLLQGLAVPGLDDLCAEAARHFGVQTALVTLLDVNELVIKAKHGIDADRTLRKPAFCNFTILTDQVFVVPDTWEEQRFASNPLVTGAPFIRFYAGAPLVFLRDVRLGALCLLHPKPREFSLGDRAELAELAGRATDAIARARFSMETQV
jgi:hypothetical protein